MLIFTCHDDIIKKITALLTEGIALKIAFLGDSITLGYALENQAERFSGKVCRILGAEEENYGITGTLVAQAGLNRNDEYSFLSRLDLILSADIAVIFGGTNDYFWSDKELFGEGEEYFSFAVEKICRFVCEKRKDKKTLLVTPYPHHGIGNYLGGKAWNTSNEHDTDELNFNGHRLCEYVEIIEQTGEKYGIPVLNLHKTPGFKWQEHTVDGCHPNSRGHDYLAEKIAEAINAI